MSLICDGCPNYAIINPKIKVKQKQKSKTMKKIPYGISDFIRLKSENFYFIDKTPYIEIIENYPSSYLMFLRPRRFGKS
ncbi:MAG: AAA family ATPase, partial [Campylobacterales bacterium]|nr:AAA family ATPase [Campylobacterales bacterium]